MRSSNFIMVLILLYQSACAPVETGISLDDLSDKTEYTDGMIVACKKFMGEPVTRIVLNDRADNSPDVLDLRSAGYYRIEIYTRGKRGSDKDVIRLVVLDPVRGQTEWGLPKWVPEGIEVGSIGEHYVQLIYPHLAPEKATFPMIAIAGGQIAESLINLHGQVDSRSFLVKRGVGSCWIPADLSARSVTIDNKSFQLEVDNFSAPPLELEDHLMADTEIPSNSHLHISSDLYIPQGITLSIGQGSFITLEQGINIHNNGKMVIEGEAEAPVTFTCSDENSYWGGVIGSANGNRVEASYAMFCRSGFHTGAGYDYGHAHRQALFYNENGSLQLDHCYMIDHIGQVFYPLNASMELDYCLVQRVKTGGQANFSQVCINHSVFTDFPNDSLIYQDEDNDGLYLHGCDAEISNSIFMYATDDGLDSGGGEGGNVNVTNTRFESIFHEGAALSSGWQAVKNHRFRNCFFTDCGQGLELGFSGIDHTVEVDSCTFLENGVGIRYGDNYDWHHNGLVKVSNSVIRNSSYHDVWNMVREEWAADTSRMEFQNVSVSSWDPMYPGLIVEQGE